MMKKIVSFFSCCLVLSLIHHPQVFASHPPPCPPNPATSPVVTVVIGTETRTGNDEVILNDANFQAHTYPNGLTIKGLLENSNAVVRVECDTTGDRLTLMNAKITVSAPVTNKVIQYWATFDKLPLPAGHNVATPQTMPDVWYKLVGSGSGGIASSNPTPASGDKIVAKGEILNPIPGTWKTIGTRTKIVMTPPSSNPDLFFATSSSWKYPPPLTGERHIRGTVTITLNNAADRVELGNGIVIHNSTVACPDCGPDDDNPPSVWCMTTNSTAQALECPSCLTEDGLVAQNKKVDMFAKSAWTNLSGDIARGEGEHLTSLAMLLEVSSEQQPSFFAWMQKQYVTLAQSASQAPEQLVRDLATKWKAAQIRAS